MRSGYLVALLLAATARAGVSPLTGESGAALVPPAACPPSLPRLAPLASTLYATDGAALYTLDTATGLETPVGGHGAINGSMAALVFSSAGTLYGFTVDSDPSRPSLYTIDTATGAATRVGPLGIGFVFEGGLAFTPDGTLYGANQNDAGAGFSFRVDPATGSAAVFGSGQARDLDGLAAIGFTVYAIDRVSNALGTVDLTTGLFTPTHVFSATVGNFGGITYDPAGGLFYAAFQGNPGLYTIDPASGQETFIGGSLLAFDLALSPVPPLAVEFDALAAERTSAGVVLRFRTLREDDTLGFVAFRAADAAMTESLSEVGAWVEAHGAGHDYTLLDPAADPGVACYYVVQEVAGSGGGSRSPAVLLPAAERTGGSGGGARSRVQPRRGH